MSFFNTRKKYLLLIPLIFLLINVFFNIHLIEDVQEALLNEKFIQTINSIEMLATTIEGYELSPRDYSDNIIRSINFLDSLPSTFAAAYIFTEGVWELKTEQSYGTDFYPFQFEEFTYKIKQVDRGQLMLKCYPENMECRNIYLYFRFMPSYLPSDERVLVVSAVSDSNVETVIPNLLGFGQWINTGITFIINVIFMILLVRLGHIYVSRKGDKWREGG